MLYKACFFCALLKMQSCATIGTGACDWTGFCFCMDVPLVRLHKTQMCILLAVLVKVLHKSFLCMN